MVTNTVGNLIATTKSVFFFFYNFDCNSLISNKEQNTFQSTVDCAKKLKLKIIVCLIKS